MAMEALRPGGSSTAPDTAAPKTAAASLENSVFEVVKSTLWSGVSSVVGQPLIQPAFEMAKAGREVLQTRAAALVNNLWKGQLPSLETLYNSSRSGVLNASTSLKSMPFAVGAAWGFTHSAFDRALMHRFGSSERGALTTLKHSIIHVSSFALSGTVVHFGQIGISQLTQSKDWESTPEETLYLGATLATAYAVTKAAFACLRGASAIFRGTCSLLSWNFHGSPPSEVEKTKTD